MPTPTQTGRVQSYPLHTLEKQLDTIYFVPIFDRTKNEDDGFLYKLESPENVASYIAQGHFCNSPYLLNTDMMGELLQLNYQNRALIAIPDKKALDDFVIERGNGEVGLRSGTPLYRSLGALIFVFDSSAGDKIEQPLMNKGGTGIEVIRPEAGQYFDLLGLTSQYMHNEGMQYRKGPSAAENAIIAAQNMVRNYLKGQGN